MPTYTNQTKLEEYLGTTLDADFAGALDLWIEAVEDYIHRFTGRKFVVDESDTTKYYEGRSAQTLWIDDITTLTSIVVKSANLTDTERALVTGDYILLPENKTSDDPTTAIRVHPNGYYTAWPAGIKRIEVTGKFGWAKVPEQIRLAATLLVAGLYEERHAANRQAREERLGDYSISYDRIDDASRRLKVDAILGSFMRHSYV